MVGSMMTHLVSVDDYGGQHDDLPPPAVVFVHLSTALLLQGTQFVFKSRKVKSRHGQAWLPTCPARQRACHKPQAQLHLVPDSHQARAKEFKQAPPWLGHASFLTARLMCARNAPHPAPLHGKGLRKGLGGVLHLPHTRHCWRPGLANHRDFCKHLHLHAAAPSSSR
jgi:hypothetical protein